MSIFYKNGVDDNIKDLKNVKQFEDGFIYVYPMPGMSEDNCQISQVLWMNPFVRVQILNSFGISSDSIKFYVQDTQDLWDLTAIETKVAIDKDYNAMYKEILNGQEGLLKDMELLQDKKVKNAPENSAELLAKIQTFFGFAAREMNCNYLFFNLSIVNTLSINQFQSVDRIFQTKHQRKRRSM